MLATHGRQRLNSLGSLVANLVPGDRPIPVPVAPAIGLVVAALVAFAFLMVPARVLEDLAADSGIAAMLTAAQPPLGTTARIAIAFFAALAAGGATWFGMFLILGARVALVGRARADDGIPVLRRADAHPDAPPRRPLFASSDLGTPFLDVKAPPSFMMDDEEEHDLPADLDTPLAAYRSPFDPPLPASPPVAPAPPEPIVPEPAPDPVTIDPDPRPVAAEFEPAPLPVAKRGPEPEPEPVAPALTPVSAPRFAPHERIETFGLTAPGGDEPSAPLPQATIHDLLDRLERGVKRQPAPAAVEEAPESEKSLEETLDALRALARRVG